MRFHKNVATAFIIGSFVLSRFALDIINHRYYDLIEINILLLIALGFGFLFGGLKR